VVVAEGIVAGVLGEEDEKPDTEAASPMAGADAFAAAVAAIASRQDPQVALDTSSFLQNQSELLKVQKRYLEQEHGARLHYLRGQAREIDIRRFGLYMRVGFQVFIGLFATAIGIGILIMLYDAVLSRSVVIDEFDVAPNVAIDVPSGKIVASGLLDVLTRIQAATRSSAERRSLSNAWTNDIAIEVPETGVSIGQFERALKARFGHDQHVEGDLTKTQAGGLALTVRGSGILPRTFVDEARDLDKLSVQAGEYVYGQSQPGLWAAYLANSDRSEDAIHFAQAAYATADIKEKPFLLNYWGNALIDRGGEGANLEALALYRGALRLKPDFWIGYNNVMSALNGLGQEEGKVRVGEQMKKVAGGRPGRAPENFYQNYDEVIWDLPAMLASEVVDLNSHGGTGTTTSSSGAENLRVAQIEAQLHDVTAATLRLKTTTVDVQNPSDVAAAADARALLAEETGDLKQAAREWDNLAAAYADKRVSNTVPQYMCNAAVTYQRTGQAAKADAALEPPGGRTMMDCFRFRADVLELRGDWAGAQTWYEKAVKLGPSLPSGYYSWGVALAKHGDLEGAAEKFKEANRRGPHWADPLKAWGDVLVKQGKSKQAQEKYQEALSYAPNWVALRDAQEAAKRAR
jgi:tetratricopeptide (TPR) repeat protein